MFQTGVFSLKFPTAVNIPMANPDLFERLRLTEISSPSKAGPQNLWRGCQPLISPIRQFCDNCKIPSRSYYLKEAEMEIAMFAHFKEYTEVIKILRVYIIMGDAVSKLETFVWILNHILRSITWSLFTLKASYFVKPTISIWSFMWWCQFIDFLPQFPAEFGNGQFVITDFPARNNCNHGYFTDNESQSLS